MTGADTSNVFKDHFSGHADAYAKFRPGYPEALFQWLAEQAPGTSMAWDAGAGNGQVARGLAPHFSAVLATDASAEQLAAAHGPDNVSFRVEPAEQCSLPHAGADLVTVGQALHWFDWAPFYAEVHRVLRPDGLFAAWTYQLNVITPAVDAVVQHFYDHIVGRYWPPERVHVERGYQDLPFPFEEIEAPAMPLRSRLDLDGYLAYIGTWSSVQRYLADQGQDPRLLIQDDMRAAWGEPQEVKEVLWPLSLRAGRPA